MVLNKILLLMLFISVSLFFSACQGNNSTPTNTLDSNNTTTNTLDSNNTTADTIADTALLSHLRLATSSITVSKNAENFTIDILAFKENNEPLNGGNILLRYPNEIVNGSTEGGSFIETQASIIDGKATFHFIGPNPIKIDTPSLNFTFVYENNTSISSILTVNYQADIPQIVLDDDNITVTKNGEITTISFSIYDKNNGLYPDGNLIIQYPDSVLAGKNVGSFNTSSAAIINGKASFIYTAPNPLNGNETLNFKVYHSAQPLLSQKDLNITIVPEANQIVLGNYLLTAQYDTSMGIEQTKQMSFSVTDDQGKLLDDSNITFISVSVLNPTLGSLEDTLGNTGAYLSVNNKNNIQMNISSKTLSGVLPIKVYTEFKDLNNKDKNLTKVFNIVVLSGPPTAMSLSYTSTTQDAEHAKFIENWVLTVTDKYNNLINTNPSVALGLITGFAQSSAASSKIANYLYYTSETNDGNLTDNNGSADIFESNRSVFGNIDLVNDKLVLFGGNGYLFHSYGKWDINSLQDNQTLTLKDDYRGNNITGLGYAVGHNFRNETCSGDPVVANVYAKDGDNTIGTTGSMIIQVEYDYYLVGKDIMLWANLVGENNNTESRIGIAKKITLRGQGLTGETYTYAKGFTGVAHLQINISNTVEFYKNARFSSVIEVTGDDTNWTVSSSSMQDGNITDCTLNAGRAYVDVNVTDPAGSAGEIKLVNVIPLNEF